MSERLTRLGRFALGWGVEIVMMPFSLFTYIAIEAAIGAIGGLSVWWSDVGFIARNIGDWHRPLPPGPSPEPGEER